LFHDAAGEYPKLAELIASARERLITAPALICDVFWSFFKHAPEIRPVVPLTPAHQLHANILDHLIATREWSEVRAAGTIGDVFNSAVATIGAAESALGAQFTSADGQAKVSAEFMLDFAVAQTEGHLLVDHEQQHTQAQSVAW